MDMVCPMLGVILYYITIFIAAHFRYYLSELSSSILGADIIFFAITYLTTILIVGLYCNMRPFNMWIDKYRSNQKDMK